MARLHLIDPDTLPTMRRLWDEGLCDPAWARKTDPEKRQVCRVCPVRQLCEQTGRAGNEVGEIWGGWSGTDSHTASRCSKGHPMVGENVQILPDGHRKCRTCDRLEKRRHYRDQHGIAQDAPSNQLKPTCRNGHQFTPETTVRRADGHRTCLICRRASQARRYAALRARATANGITIEQQQHRDTLTRALKKKTAA